MGILKRIGELESPVGLSYGDKIKYARLKYGIGPEHTLRIIQRVKPLVPGQVEYEIFVVE